MAGNTKRRVNPTERKRSYIGYEEGSAVRKLEELPKNQKKEQIRLEEAEEV